MEQKDKKRSGLPENANRELKDGEKYVPILPPEQNVPEVSFYSVSVGVLMAVLFSAAAAYLGLKVGQVFEAAIPIAIIAVGLSSVSGRKNALGENVIIQSIGSASGVIVAGAIFTLPALYILQAKYPDITVSFMQVFLSSLLGGILGILFLIPFRKYFVSDMHGKYPFPEATATTQVLVSGEKGGGQAKSLIFAAAVGGVYDFIVSTFGTWSETLSSRMIPLGETIAQKLKLTFSINTSAAVLGLGYIVGLKYSTIICAGSLFVWWFIIPLLGMTTVDSVMLSGMEPEVIFTNYARYIGIGGIAMAGIIGIVKSWGVIKSAVGLAGKEFGGKAKAVAQAVLRTQRDLSMRFIVIATVLALIATLLFFYFGVIHNFMQAFIAFVVVTLIAFLFTTVAANAIAIVGTNPVSGMTLMTLIIASIILVATGLKGTSGMVAAMVIGGVVCTALSMAGGFITDLKIGYWIGTTPAKQETWKFLGTLVSAATVGGVIIILEKTYGFTGENALVAPQANAMAAVIEPLMMGQGAPWLLYGVGAILALLINVLGVPALAFALGMFIPLQLNTPLVIGGLISWFVTSRSKDKKLNTLRGDKGMLVASGFIAGGALMGVVSAALKFAGVDWYQTEWSKGVGAEWLGVGMYLLIIGYFVWTSLRVKKEA
ncbi:MAG TPA: oligopeptide transporter, OPT family [Paludibacteraceae bacterium]|nr:oligopeptide transporter, OPT family [Paludibacteraceae bacterium]HOS37869.1 oligopeptide transporter, OPT family [Paludibacteraceae bacterium]HPD27913.1 oligopeptide transporter, OPT family [Paludibacteraceae bacterium]HPK20455.1 oligopeptide transporter, OPT family [Paludibacteraceae bacterium]HRR58912.1 oligopeptide transporter, OPT family [Paludibacteraceae bacterium]